MFAIKIYSSKYFPLILTAACLLRAFRRRLELNIFLKLKIVFSFSSIYTLQAIFSPLIFTQFARDKHRRHSAHRLRGAFRSRFLVCLLLVFTVNTFYLRVLNVNRKFHWFNPRCSYCVFITGNCVKICWNFRRLQETLPSAGGDRLAISMDNVQYPETSKYWNIHGYCNSVTPIPSAIDSGFFIVIIRN